MKLSHVRTKPFPALIAALALAGPATDTELAFAPAEGTKLTKSFESEGSYTLDDLSIVADGQDVTQLLGTLELSMVMANTVAVTDSYEKMGSGRPTRLVRTFDEISSTFEMSVGADGDFDGDDFDAGSPLEGESVAFVLDEDTGEYICEFVSEGPDDDLLEGLEEDMDLRFLLPTEAVSAEDTWEVDVASFQRILQPGGDLAIDTSEIGDGDDIEEMNALIEGFSEGMTERMEELFSGESTCTLKGIEDGVAVITVELEIGSAVDMVDIMEDLLAELGDEAGEEVPLFFEIADVNLDLEAEGTLLWNVEGGHAVEFTIESDGVIGLDLGASMEAMGESSSFEVALELSFSLAYEITFE